MVLVNSVKLYRYMSILWKICAFFALKLNSCSLIKNYFFIWTMLLLMGFFWVFFVLLLFLTIVTLQCLYAKLFLSSSLQHTKKCIYNCNIVIFLWKKREKKKELLLMFITAIKLYYSLDKGITWLPILRECNPSETNCDRLTSPVDSQIASDGEPGWHRHNIHLPFHTRCVIQFKLGCLKEEKHL